MDWIDATRHVLAFVAPAIGLGAMAAGLAKWVYRRDLAGAPWLHLASMSTVAALLMQVGGLVVFGHDGRMATYGAMVAACAVTLWWRGFGPGRRR